MNTSIKLPTPCELINVTPVNPLISKCQIKVCWVGDEPNRNKSIITKEVARDLANSLPGSPIVGFYNEETGDFEQHNRAISIKNGKFELKDTTRPYGFVDLNAKVWFQKFLDSGVEHEYLMTEGWLWTGQYPECRRIIEKGNNQSMELDEKLIDATWTKDKNGKNQFFIINEGIISKLCILGEDYEPCFEGAQITKVQFAFEDNFKEQLFSMISEIKNLLNEGGTSMNDDMTPVIVEEPIVEPAAEPVKEPVTEPVVEEPAVEPSAEPVVEEPADPVEPVTEEPVVEPAEPVAADPEPVAQYNLEEIPEYVELRDKYAALKNDFNTACAARDALQSENTELLAFRASVEKEKKQAMIKSFYMLTDEDKKDVIDNIDTYSLEDIEAKLSIICVRNKVSFSLDDDNKSNEPIVYNLEDNNDDAGSVVPAWVKAVQAVAKNN